jgi:hypothetical protein
MAVPPPSHTCWSRAASGQLATIQTSNLGLQLLSQRLKTSQSAPGEKATEIRAFFVRYEKILSNEIAQLERM